MEESRELYIYDHCPYCLKAPHDFRPEKYPRRITCFCSTTTQKHPPGWSVKTGSHSAKDDSRYMPESMDIVHYVDKLDGKPLLTGKRSLPLKSGCARSMATPTNCCCRVLPNRHLMSFLLLPRANISSTRKRPARVILPTCWPTLTV